jgi:D-glycero-D-manno-heptose 1,7-bisphosphate phosphatase
MTFDGSHRAPAVFFDKDGTLVEDLPYNVDPGRMSLVPGALRALAALTEARLSVFVVTNQPGVALGLFAESDLPPVERWLRDSLSARGLPFGGMYWCPHHPQGCVTAYAGACGCRKPQPGLLLRAAREHGIALEQSWVVGDTLDDIEAARRAGCRAILFDNGHEKAWQRTALRTPDYIVSSLPAAAEIILARPTVRPPVVGRARPEAGSEFFG